MFVPTVEIGTKLKITFTDYYQQKQLCTKRGDDLDL